VGAIDNALGWNKLSWTKKILIAIPIVGALIGWQYYNKSQEAKATKAEMLTMCSGEAACIEAVEKYAASCFDEHYHMGRRSQGVLMDDFVACVNKSSGTDFFVSVPKE
jgi:predicted negative regulator of RcsB-dependent stress response